MYSSMKWLAAVFKDFSKVIKIPTNPTARLRLILGFKQADSEVGGHLE